MKRGFLLGKFMPPHNGHMLLCDFARNYCDQLTILVCTRSVEPIAGQLRHDWMRELQPQARVLHLARDDIPQEPSDSPVFWDIWRETVTKAHPEPIDFVFSSEPYGERLAQEVEARWVPFDMERNAAPISATMVRENPFRAWRYIPGVVQAHYVRSVCLHGPESSGKSTLARQLAAHYRTIMAPEYARTYCAAFGNDCDADDLRAIVRGQNALREAARRQANRLLVQDTDALMTAIWADMLLGSRPPGLNQIDRMADFYLLCDIDFPWTDDGTRYRRLSDQATRRRFFDLCRAELDDRHLPYEVVSGAPDERLRAAISLIDERFPGIRDPY